ncbi:CLUMA_CG017187, isoform A [Clunio marinus]|uniref:CLUMA_CG017187, isoform A n=1 Tax=Clunio marinus TaxID=568069 RepID=A0A1J1IZR1_9DIPT|nr:CLUMA_CG017187, isoform A [Clunio marinus]
MILEQRRFKILKQVQFLFCHKHLPYLIPLKHFPLQATFNRNIELIIARDVVGLLFKVLE